MARAYSRLPFENSQSYSALLAHPTYHNLHDIRVYAECTWLSLQVWSGSREQMILRQINLKALLQGFVNTHPRPTIRLRYKRISTLERDFAIAIQLQEIKRLHHAIEFKLHQRAYDERLIDVCSQRISNLLANFEEKRDKIVGVNLIRRALFNSSNADEILVSTGHQTPRAQQATRKYFTPTPSSGSRSVSGLMHSHSVRKAAQASAHRQKKSRARFTHRRGKSTPVSTTCKHGYSAHDRHQSPR